jgi:hypothetical protein
MNRVPKLTLSYTGAIFISNNQWQFINCLIVFEHTQTSSDTQLIYALIH